MAVSTLATIDSAQSNRDSDDLATRYGHVRGVTERLCAPLATEDYVIQSMPDVSPTRWHIAHVSWFFETFVLKPGLSGYAPFHADFEYLFNSYYNGVGAQFPRHLRGTQTRPSVDAIWDYRRYIDQQMARFFEALDTAATAQWAPVVEVGLHHEQQHQELLLTDIKHVLTRNPLYPNYAEPQSAPEGTVAGIRWHAFDEQIAEIGFAGNGFAYDNEGPRHRRLIHPFAIASRLVTNGEYRAFLDDKAYSNPLLWLADGWATVQQEGWTQPLYWVLREGAWFEATLRGLQPLDPDAPVCHLSYYEADAYARWSGARLPTEFEWEVATAAQPIAGNFVESERFHPQRAAGEGLQQCYGDVWEWTRSSYEAYPGYRPAPGAIGEYNGKFMCNQYVLRGGSCATSQSHMRKTYRNFFPANARWQFSGVRLTKDGA